jgi:hypothetical protein
MDTESLVEERVNDGQKVIAILLAGGFPVTAAFWLKATENDKWYFYVASAVVDDEGLAKAYRKLHPLVRVLPQPCWVDPLEIKLIGPSNPIAKDVLAAQARAGGPGVSPLRWRGKRLGTVSIEEAYFYPLP